MRSGPKFPYVEVKQIYYWKWFCELKAYRSVSGDVEEVRQWLRYPGPVLELEPACFHTDVQGAVLEMASNMIRSMECRKTTKSAHANRQRFGILSVIVFGVLPLMYGVDDVGSAIRLSTVSTMQYIELFTVRIEASSIW